VPEDVVTDNADPVDDEPATPEPVSKFDQLQQSVLQMLDAKCGSCHGAEAIANGNVQGGLDCITDMECLVQSSYITPGYSETSPLVQRMLDGTMPPKGVQPALTDADIDQVGRYIRFPLWWGQ
jgi:mono/diheme cytochrome c family protein